MRSGPSIGIGCDKCGATAVVPLSQADWNLSHLQQQGAAVARPVRLPVGWCHLEVTWGAAGASLSGPSIDLCDKCGDALVKGLSSSAVAGVGEG